MRIKLLSLSFACLLLLQGAPARAQDGSSSCGSQAGTLGVLEIVATYFQDAPGPFAGFLAQLFENWARNLAIRYADDCVALNQVQVLGSHNSYHIEPPQSLIDIYVNFEPIAVYWQYTHAPLPEQFSDSGIRQIELDVYADPDGGLWASPLGYQILQTDAEDPDVILDELLDPGLKVLHVHQLDWQSTCPTFVGCLMQVKDWSDANPGHLPIMILVEVKDDPLPVDIGVTDPEPFTANDFDQVEAEILSVFPLDQIITPDDVRGGAATLEEAVLTTGWPRLGVARGRVLFALDNAGKRALYAAGSPALEGKLMFTDAPPGAPDAGFMKRNHPANVAEVQDRVADGYLVRTRADADTIDARMNDTTRREQALTSGGHYVSTDYEVPDPRPEFNGYTAAIPDGEPGRCNPINAPAGCRNYALEP